MARSSSTTTAEAQTDGGNLWTLIQGEQLEYEVALSFLTNADAGYTFEAVIVEALNIAGVKAVPVTIRPSGVQSTLTVRIPPEKGFWNPATAYSAEDVVEYGAKTYKKLFHVNEVSSVLPDTLTEWVEYTPNKVYIQFPETLTLTPAYSVQPTTSVPVYGFFELRVTAPLVPGVYQQTWKPLRGTVEFLFSPTQLVI